MSNMSNRSNVPPNSGPGNLSTTCPKCGTEIKLEDTIAAPLLARQQQQFETRLKQEREANSKDAMTKARAELGDQLTTTGKELEALRQRDKDQQQKLKAAQDQQAQFLAKERALEDKAREINLTIEKQVTAAKAEMFKQAQKQLEDDQAIKLREKDEQLASMSRKIEELQKKAAQGSQQLQGEAMELHLEDSLRARFPQDRIDEIKKGVSGADIQQTVISETGQPAGAILWELKRTRNWSNDWIPKLKTDMRNAGAELAILVSEARPDGIDTFDFYEGVYVAAPRYVIPLALVTRQTLLNVARLKRAQSGQQDKVGLVYEYLTGSQFKHRIEAIVENFQTMQEDINKERTRLQRHWAKQEKQLQAVIENTVGLHGDLEGIAGRAMPQIEGLALDDLEDDEQQ